MLRLSNLNYRLRLKLGRCQVAMTVQKETRDDNDIEECSVDEVTYESKLQKH